MAPQYWLPTIHGAIRIGTTSEYWNQESGVEHRLGDTREGTTLQNVNEELRSRSGRIGNFTFKNLSTSGSPGASIAVNNFYGSFVYCVSAGDYNRGLHSRISARNPSLSCFVVFDTNRLALALLEAMNSRAPLGLALWHADHVQYAAGARSESLSLDGLLQQFSQETGKQTRALAHARRAVFLKEADYEHEQEFRFAGLPIMAMPKPILLNRLDPRFARAVSASVVSAGTLGG